MSGAIRMRNTRPAPYVRKKWEPSTVITVKAHEPDVCSVCGEPIEKGSLKRHRTWSIWSSHTECGDPVEPKTVSKARECECMRFSCTLCAFKEGAHD